MVEATDLLDPEWAAFVRDEIASGRFASERDVLTELKSRHADFERLRAHVAEGVVEADRGAFAEDFSIDALIAKVRSGE